MTKRVKLHIDTIAHFNHAKFEVYRDIESDVDMFDVHVMDVHDDTALRTDNKADKELLIRDTDTPYAFYTKRHFKTTPFPDIWIGSDKVQPRDIRLFPEDKMIEIHNGELGYNDSRNVYMTYHYDTFDVLDDYVSESGKDYFGPPATGLRIPLKVTVTQDHTTDELIISYETDDRPVTYFYRIRAVDTEQNSSPLSYTKNIDLLPEILYFRIERSKDGRDWEEIAFSNMHKWATEITASDNPKGIQNLKVMPLNSKEAKIEFLNPWKTYLNDPRQPYQYRIRTEDLDGEVSHWFPFTIEELYVKPKHILIRRKVDNGKESTETLTDAFTVFDIDATTLDKNADKIELIDNQLTDATIYGYTFFYKDILDKSADTLYAISDHTPWANILSFAGTTQEDIVTSSDFITAFELADKIIEIGTE